MKEWANTIYDENLKFTTPLPDADLLATLPRDINILDVGCGYGRTVVYLHNLGFKKLTGFDISEHYIARAKKDCIEANLFVADFKNFNLQKSYDLILLMGVIEYILTDKKQDIFFEKISRNLSEGGCVLLETFIIDVKSNWKQYLFGLVKTFHWGTFKNSKGFECHHQSIASLEKILQKHFIIESAVKKDYFTWTNSLSNGYFFSLKKKIIL